MDTNTPAAEVDAMTERALTIDSYRLYIGGTRASSGEPRLEMNCPHQHCPGSPDGAGCSKNLIDDAVLLHPFGPVELGTLWDLAADHETARDGYTPPACTVVDVPDVGPIRIQSDIVPAAEDRQALRQLIRATQRRMIDDLKAEGQAELAGRIAKVQQTLAVQHREAIAIRETADGPSAGIAGTRADLIGQVLRLLDEAVSGG